MGNIVKGSLLRSFMPSVLKGVSYTRKFGLLDLMEMILAFGSVLKGVVAGGSGLSCKAARRMVILFNT